MDRLLYNEKIKQIFKIPYDFHNLKVLLKKRLSELESSVELSEFGTIPSQEIKVKIVPKATGVIINMYSKLRENLDIPATMQEIINGAASIVSDKLGVKVIKTNLTIVGFTAEKKVKEEVGTEAVSEQDKDLSEKENKKGKTARDK